mmetsp:Transcript_32031/g.106031  ORF Transcript_32031/g.106031 Transcript_32031/m.106031 type:complete len:183 (+) Transcript_32031:113-661(+)
MAAHGHALYDALQGSNWRSTLRLLLICFRNCPRFLEQPPQFAVAALIVRRNVRPSASFLGSLSEEQAAASANMLARLVDDASSHAASGLSRWRFESVVHLRTLPAAVLEGCAPSLQAIASRDPDARVCAAARNALRQVGHSVARAPPAPHEVERAGPACRCLQPKCVCGAPSRRCKPDVRLS